MHHSLGLRRGQSQLACFLRWILVARIALMVFAELCVLVQKQAKMFHVKQLDWQFTGGGGPQWAGDWFLVCLAAR